MRNLIKAELFKLQRNKPFWVLILTITGLSALLHYLTIIDWWQVTGTPFDSAGLSDLNALSAYTVPLYFNLIVSTLGGFFIAIEFSNSGVIKNQLISGNKRSHIYIAKYLVFSLGAIIVTILIPLLIGVITLVLLGQGDILSFSNMMYLGRAYTLFTLQFLGFTAIITLLAILTEDSGKTIIFSIVFTFIMFAVEQLSQSSFINTLYEHFIFHQFNEVFKVDMTLGEIIKSVLIGVISSMVILLCGIVTFNKKEIK